MRPPPPECVVVAVKREGRQKEKEEKEAVILPSCGMPHCFSGAFLRVIARLAYSPERGAENDSIGLEAGL